MSAPGPGLIHERSPPAQKAFPAPVMITARTAGSPRSDSIVALNASDSSGVIAFRTSGRFKVMRDDTSVVALDEYRILAHVRPPQPLFPAGNLQACNPRDTPAV